MAHVSEVQWARPLENANREAGSQGRHGISRTFYHRVTWIFFACGLPSSEVLTEGNGWICSRGFGSLYHLWSSERTEVFFLFPCDLDSGKLFWLVLFGLCSPELRS